MWFPDVITSTPAASIESAVDGVSPIPPATFSPLGVTKSIPRSSRSPGSSCSTATRPGLPIRSPIIRTRQAPGGRGLLPFATFPRRVRPMASCPWGSMPRYYRSGLVARFGRPSPVAMSRVSLLGVLDGAGLADDGDLDLARVGQLLLDLLDDVAGEAARGQVVDLLRTHEDADLAPGLDRER